MPYEDRETHIDGKALRYPVYTHGEGKPLLDAQFMLTPPCKRTLSRSRDLYSTVSGPRRLVRDRFMANMLPAI